MNTDARAAWSALDATEAAVMEAQNATARGDWLAALRACAGAERAITTVEYHLSKLAEGEDNEQA